MGQMAQANGQQLEQGKIIKKELSKAFWIYQLGYELSNSYEHLQSLVFCASMISVVKKLYADSEEQQKEVLKRHLNFSSTEGAIGASIQGIATATEEEKSNGATIPDTTITSIKTRLIGPLAGIGDSTIWATLVPLVISIFIPIAKEDNVIGSIGPLVLYTAIILYISWTLVNKSYTLGHNSILSLLEDGKIEQVVYSANVLGMITMDALGASYVKIASPMTFKVTGDATIALQDILDQIMKGLLPLAAVMTIYLFMVKEGLRYGIIIGTVVLVSLVTSFFGLL